MVVVVDHFYRALFGPDRDYGWFQTVMIMTSQSPVCLSLFVWQCSSPGVLMQVCVINCHDHDLTVFCPS